MPPVSTSSQPEPKFSIVFVIGLARSGSTLLGRLLNNHPSIVDIGELLRLNSKLDDPTALCACGSLLTECPDWNKYFEGIPEKVKRNYRKWTPRLLHQLRMNAKADVLVDVSKTLAYRLAKRWKDPDVGFILIVRDPRGALRSHITQGKDLDRRLKLQRKWMKRYQTFATKRAHCCKVTYYEDLVSKPKTTMRELCEFIGVNFNDSMLAPQFEQCHMSHYSDSSYMKGARELRLDERWRDEIDPRVIAHISKELAQCELYEKRYHLSESA